MYTYFQNVQTLDELRKQYKNLLKKYHPDNGGSEEITKAINVEYERLFKILKDSHSRQNTAEGNTNGNHSSYGNSYDNMKYDFAEDQLLREMLQKVIYLSDITIEIIGNWIWISGNTCHHRKELKELGFKFASQKKCWFWHSESFRKKSHRQYPWTISVVITAVQKLKLMEE